MKRLIGRKSSLICLAPILLILMVSGCQVTKPPAVGKERRINVVADEADWYRVGAIVRGKLNKTVKIFFDEQVFTTKWVKPERFADYQKRKNLFIICSLRDTTFSRGRKPGAELLKKIMSPASLDSLKRVKVELLFLRDFWADDQLVVLAAATDGYLLERMLKVTMDRVYKEFEEVLNGRIYKHIYRVGYLDIERLYRRFGWRIEIPANYKLEKEDPAGHFYQFFRAYPDRSVFIYWENERREDMSDETLIDLREQLAQKYYHGEAVNKEYTKVVAAEFAGYPARKIIGFWENNELVLGGSFRTYCINTQDRFFMIDLKLFAAGLNKESWLRQLEVIASTFKVKG